MGFDKNCCYTREIIAVKVVTTKYDYIYFYYYLNYEYIFTKRF